MTGKKKGFGLNEVLRHENHQRPVSRRDFLAQGFTLGAGAVLAPSMLGMLGLSSSVQAALSSDIAAQLAPCDIAATGSGKIPFICFDLAGGANIAGSNVLVGQQGGQLDFLTTAGYSKLGLPGDMIPPVANPVTGTNDFINTDFGLAFHSDSAFLRGIQERAGSRAGNVNGVILPSRSENDTSNNPLNPMYGIYKAGADGELLSLIGSRNSESGGNSMAPAAMIDLSARPTKVDRPSDVTGMVDTGQLIKLMSKEDAVRVMEAMSRISDTKMSRMITDAAMQKLVSCGYVKSADLVDRFSNPAALNPQADPDIVGASGIFSSVEFDDDSEFRKTASVMKMVIDGYAGAGTISMGGYDYHTGDRSTGERRDLRAGRCMGACLEYAARRNKPLMIYVFSDGSLSSNGRADNSADGRGKGEWTSDNQSTAAAFFLVYNPGGRPVLLGGTTEEQARHQQIGWFRPDGSLDTSSSVVANNPNLLVETIVLNYMALNGEAGNFQTLFPSNGLGNTALMDSLIAFSAI
ncbi:MAG: hypothetical protein V3W04_02605 [Gammaproteobacteria bacterium]